MLPSLRSSSHVRSASVLALLALCSVETIAAAEPASPEGAIAQNDMPPPAAAGAPMTPPPAAGTPSPMNMTPPPPPAAAPPPAAGMPSVPDATPAAEKPAGAPKWYDAIAFDAFFDGYAQFNFNFPRPQAPQPFAPSVGLGGNQFRQYDTSNGFALNWVGVNASVTPDPVGGTISLRIGPGARIHSGNDDQYGLELLKQAYASWKPGGKDSPVQLDFGKFDQPYGAEVAETQFNMNYSRGSVYTFLQPLFFTGFRLDYAPTAAFDMKLLLVNGWNNSVGLNNGKTVGVQFNFKPSDTSLLSVGYAFGPQQADATVSTSGATPVITDNPGATSRFKHIVDAIVDVTVANNLRFLLNGDLNNEALPDALAAALGKSSTTWYGASLDIRYAFGDPFGIALRGEVVSDPDGWALQTFKKGTTMIDGTLTFEMKPTNNLIFKLEGRIDSVTTDDNSQLFLKDTNETAKIQPTALLGMVVKTN